MFHFIISKPKHWELEAGIVHEKAGEFSEGFVRSGIVSIGEATSMAITFDLCSHGHDIDARFYVVLFREILQKSFLSNSLEP